MLQLDHKQVAVAFKVKYHPKEKSIDVSVKETGSTCGTATLCNHIPI